MTARSQALALASLGFVTGLVGLLWVLVTYLDGRANFYDGLCATTATMLLVGSLRAIYIVGCL